MILKINKYEVQLNNICELLEDGRNTYRKKQKNKNRIEGERYL